MRTTRHTRRIGVGAAAALIAGLLGAGGSPGQAAPVTPSTSFDPSAVSWSSWHNQTSAQYGSTFTQQANAGNLPIDLDVENPSGAYSVGSVWQKNLDGRAWVSRRNLTLAQYSAAFNDYHQDGYRQVEQETYVVDGVRMWAGIWIKNTEALAYATNTAQTAAQFSSSFTANKNAGLMPVDYDEYVTSAGLRYNSVWVKAPARTTWYLDRGLSSSQFSTRFGERSATHRAVAFDSVATASGQRHAAIWVPNNGRGWLLFHNMSLKGYENQWNRLYDEGYRVVSYDRYQTSSGTRYAAIWRQNSSRPNWSLKAQVDAWGQAEKNKGVPGLAIAAYVKGQPAYLRGFGNADNASGTWMDTRHVGNLASISKAVTATTLFKMRESATIGVYKYTRAYVPEMPAHHTHTVGQLLAHQGCVRTDNATASDGVKYATSLAAAKAVWNAGLICTPGPTQHHYSNLGFTLVGAAMEKAGGTSFQNLVLNKLTTPYKLGTLAPAFTAPTNQRRMTNYTGNSNTAMSRFDHDWAMPAAGIDSSTVDLARFGDMLARSQILPEAARNLMWTRQVGDYAYGWVHQSVDGTDMVWHNGSWNGTRTMLVIFPAYDITVAVIANSRAFEVNPDALAIKIGRAVLAKEKAS